MNLDIVTNKIVSNYIDHGKDLNESIAKYAEKNECNIEQTKRLVEKVNQETYLAKFAKDGSQTFDIADYGKVKGIVQNLNNDSIEKKASITKEDKVNYGENNVYNDMEKKASEMTYSLEDINKSIDFCTTKINQAMEKIASSFKDKRREYNFESMSKLAEEASNEEQKTIDHYTKVRENLLEKRAGIVTGIVKGVANVSLKAGGKAVGFVAKAPMKRGLIPMMYTQSAISGAKKATPEIAQVVSNVAELPKMAEEIEKDAGLASRAIEVLDKAAPYLLVSGALMGAEVLAHQVGGIAGKMMNNRQLNQSFNNIMEANKDLNQIPQARAYYDVIARHSPSLALDPMTAPQLIRQFDAFGGVDLNTVGKLREIQDRGQSKNTSSPLFDFGTLGNALKGNKMIGDMEKDKYSLRDMRFKRINDIAEQNPTFSNEKKFKIANFTAPNQENENNQENEKKKK